MKKFKLKKAFKKSGGQPPKAPVNNSNNEKIALPKRNPTDEGFFKISKEILLYIGTFLDEHDRYNYSVSCYRLRDIFAHQKFLQLEFPSQDHDFSSCKSYFNITQEFGKKCHITEVTQLHDGRLVIGYSNGNIEVAKVVDNTKEEKGYKKKIKSKHRVDSLITYKNKHKSDIIYLRQISPTQFVSCDRAKFICLWNINEEGLEKVSYFDVPNLPIVEKGSTPPPISFCLLDDNHLAIASEEKIFVKDLTGVGLKTVIGLNESVLCIKKTKKNKVTLVTASSNSELRIGTFDMEKNIKETEELEKYLNLEQGFVLKHKSLREIEIPKDDDVKELPHVRLNRFGECLLFNTPSTKNKFMIFQEGNEKWLKESASSERDELSTDRDLVTYRMTDSGKLLFWGDDIALGRVKDKTTELRLVNFEYRK